MTDERNRAAFGYSRHAPGGTVLGEITNGGSPASGSPTFTTRQVLATALDLLGIPPTLYMPPDAPPLTEALL